MIQQALIELSHNGAQSKAKLRENKLKEQWSGSRTFFHYLGLEALEQCT
jgi:hypothetical protein